MQAKKLELRLVSSREPKKNIAAARKKVVPLWNAGHRTWWIAMHLEIPPHEVTEILQRAEKRGEQVRREKVRMSPTLSDWIRGKYDPTELADRPQYLTPAQRVLVGDLVRAKDHRMSAVDASARYWNTVSSCLARGLVEWEQTARGIFLKLTDRGQMSSHIHPPLEVVLADQKAVKL